jgi:erythromycin esterase
MMLTVLATVASILCAAGAGTAADERVEWLRAAAAALRSIDINDEDFSDLAPLKRAIGESRIVLLGEQTHGDGATFSAKARLVRFLHQEMGFDVLAWESGTFDCRRMDAALLAGRPAEEAADLGLFSLWGQTAEVQPLLEYLARVRGDDRPLEVAGFDCQFSSRMSRERFPAVVAAFFDAADPKLLSDDDRGMLESAVAVAAHRSGGESAADRAVRARALKARAGAEQILAMLRRERASLEAVHDRDEVCFMERSLENLGRLMAMHEAMLKNDWSGGVAIRNRRMGENMIWLADERYEGRKIIIWAASWHIARDMRSMRSAEGPPLDVGRGPTTGDVAFGRGGDGAGGLRDAYSIAFTSRHGQAALVGRPPMTITPAGPDTLEALLSAAGEPLVFLDIRSLPGEHFLRGPMAARLMGHQSVRAVWPDAFDGIIFIEEMRPASKRE